MSFKIGDRVILKRERSATMAPEWRDRAGSVVPRTGDRPKDAIAVQFDDVPGVNYWCEDSLELWAFRDHVILDIKNDAINHPNHYGGDTPYEAIKVIEAWGLGFCLGNTVKYISRAGKKDDIIQDLEKAQWYLQREIDAHKKVKDAQT